MVVRGTIRGTRQGFAFLAREEGSDDLYVAEENLHGAIDGDRVEVSLIRRSPRDFRVEAVVEKVLERTRPIMTGNVIRLGRTFFVSPDTPILPARIRLSGLTESLPAGAKVLFRIREHREGAAIEASFEEVLGEGNDPALDAVVVSTAYQLPARFPDEAVDEAIAAAGREDAEEIAGRCSYADRLVLTIDPETAKDFDDAISLQKDAAGYHLQVHIADVSWFVAEGGALDREASRRGNSVYFPGSVIPMLPEVLSTRTASLVPGEERRVLTVEVDLDHEGEPLHATVREGLIRSSARLHYGQAQEILEHGGGDPELERALRLMAELARRLRRRRFARGGFDLDIPEAEMTLDAVGVPATLTRHRTLETNRLIEEFMILANRSVGRFVAEAGMPLIFRVHEEPEAAALERFAPVALTLISGASPRELESIPALRRFLAGLPSGALTSIVHAFFLRSMKQAVYSPIDAGHFGLGIDRYCHYTSPIRRYPDLWNHRVVRWLIQNPSPSPGDRAAASRSWQAGVERVCLACNKTERVAVAAEREIVKLKVLRWAERRLGECHWGRVVGLTSSGLFIELEEFPVEGFVARATLRAGSRLQEERLAFVEGRSKWELRLGDRVEVQIARVDVRDRRLDLLLTVSGRRGKGRRAPAGPEGAGRRKQAGARKPKRGEDRVKGRAGRAERKRGGGRSKKTRIPRHRSGGSR